ncbi:hypothetical protein, partial [Arthrobacter sp. DR-2P]
ECSYWCHLVPGGRCWSRAGGHCAFRSCRPWWPVPRRSRAPGRRTWPAARRSTSRGRAPGPQESPPGNPSIPCSPSGTGSRGGTASTRGDTCNSHRIHCRDGPASPAGRRHASAGQACRL